MRRVGDNPNPCEDDGWHKVITCSANGDHVRMIRHNCWDRACPRCAAAWARRSAKRAAARIAGLAALFAYDPRHVVLSAPVGLFAEGDNLADLRKTFRDVAIASGLHGGSLVVHGWRERHRGEGDWYWSPHAHLIAWGRVASRPKAWIIKVIRAITSRADAEATTAYELDHAAYQGSGSAITWYGSVSYARVATEYTRSVEVSACLICGAPEIEIRDDPESGEKVPTFHLEVHYTAKCRLRPHKARSAARKRSKWGDLRTTSRARA